MASNLQTAATAAIFVLTYIVVTIGRVPGLRIDRAGAALVGGSLMLAVDAVPLDALGKAIDMPTLALLLGLMIVVGNLRLSGFFRLVNGWVVARAHHPLQLLAAVIVSSGVFSAFLLNDAICLVMTPLVVDIARRLRRDPVPYLLGVAMASNVGSTATITGNPQNILIGSFSGLPYGRFAAALSPVAAVGLVLTFGLIWLMHRREFRRGDGFAATRPPTHLHRPLALKALVVTVAMVAAFFTGAPPAEVALVAGGAMLLTRIVRSERTYREIDWPLLLMFAGLFVVVAGFERVLLTPQTIAEVSRLHLDQVPALGLVTALLSNLVSNVPAVLVLRPFMGAAGDPGRAWLTVAMASTLAGNLTILGSVANLIVVQGARSKGITIGFWDYFRVGAPLTVLTILVGVCWLSLK
ncbi:MAG TPA: anion transporter [Stellaceae bacterium]|nr:anion transporter [Stellaceae bacterium]